MFCMSTPMTPAIVDEILPGSAALLIARWPNHAQRRYSTRNGMVSEWRMPVGLHQLNLLAVSDQVDPRIHSGSLRQRMPEVDLVLGCGDVPARYLEFLADALDHPVYFVLGNHHEELTRKGMSGHRYEPMGCIDVGGKVKRARLITGLILAGFPGSPRYSRETDQQYSDNEIRWMMVQDDAAADLESDGWGDFWTS